MSDSYFNISAFDRVELDEIVKNISFKEFKSDLLDSIEAVVDEDYGEDAIKAMAEQIFNHIEFKYLIEDFINGIGLMGWEIFSRSACVEIKKRLKFYQAFTKSKLPEYLKQRIRKKLRVPRIKKLLGDKEK